MIRRAKIRFHGSVFYICDDCEAVWEENEEISNRTGRASHPAAAEPGIPELVFRDELEYPDSDCDENGNLKR